ncbi:MAG: NAD(+) synthase, partial [Planctomycetota bacterium]
MGAVEDNARRVAALLRAAAARGADLVVFPELVLTGYPPRDLLERREFVEEVLAATERLARVVPETPALVGTLARDRRGRLLNAAALLEGGRVRAIRAKALLPAHDVFDEARHFAPAPGPARPLCVGERRVGVLLCEDLWDEGYARSPSQELRRAGAQLLVCLNASPYRRGVVRARLNRARRSELPLAYVNAVGAQDELIFDGSSFALDGAGRVLASLPPVREELGVVDLFAPAAGEARVAEASLREALLCGLRGFVEKNRLPGVVVGLSGGVDSALVLCLAVEALGPERVLAVHLPSRFTSTRSTRDARRLCARLEVPLEEISLEPLHRAAEQTLAPLGFSDRVSENAQARLRALVLMAHVNRRGGALLNTSNKTELALGYGTLYGDLGGALGVIADLNKTEAVALAREAYGDVIPASVLERPPSAELAPDQVDPFDYPRIAPLVDLHVGGAGPAELVAAGATPAEAAWLVERVRASEFKRAQAPPGLKVSWKAFGSGRRIPQTHAHHRRRAPPQAGRREPPASP